MNVIVKRIIPAALFCAAAISTIAIMKPGGASAEESSAKVCAPSVTSDKTIPDSGQYEYDCKMAAATCMAFGIVGAYGTNQSGQNSGFGRCFRKAIAKDEREYEAWERQQETQFKSGPKSSITIFRASYFGNFYQNHGQTCDATKAVAAICKGVAPCLVHLSEAKCELSEASGPTMTDPRASDGSVGMEVEYICTATGKRYGSSQTNVPYVEISCPDQ